jgi:hypothetical protein
MGQGVMLGQMGHRLLINKKICESPQNFFLVLFGATSAPGVFSLLLLSILYGTVGVGLVIRGRKVKIYSFFDQNEKVKIKGKCSLLNWIKVCEGSIFWGN